MDPDIAYAFALTVLLIVVTGVLLFMQHQDRRDERKPPRSGPPVD